MSRLDEFLRLLCGRFDNARQLEELMDALRQLAESAGSAQQEAEALRAKETLAVADAARGRTELAALDATRTQAQARQAAIAADSAAARYETKKALNAQRTEDCKNGTYARAGGVVDPLPEDAPFFVKDYYDYYKTERGYTERSLNSNQGWNVTSSLSFLNMPILQYSNEIRSAVLVIHGEKAHSCYFSRDAFQKLTGDNKELLIIPGASHVDLYDRMDVIPFEKLKRFFEEYLRKLEEAREDAANYEEAEKDEME